MTDQPERLSRATLDVAAGLSLNWGENWDAEMRHEIIGHLTKTAHALSASEKRAEEAETLASRRLAGNAQLLLWKQQVEHERDEARASLERVVEDAAKIAESYVNNSGLSGGPIPDIKKEIAQAIRSSLPPTTRGG